MIQGIKKKIFYILRAPKHRLSFIIVILILFCLIYLLFFNITIESQSVLSVLLSVLGIVHVNSFKGITIDSDNVSSALGTLAQSNATILAIVISLSLLVIEFSASKYSARVVDVFKRDPILWGFLILYGFSIFIPVFLIIFTTTEMDDLTLHQCFSAVYKLSIVAYFSLFFYIRHVFKMMKPSSVIGVLSKKIDLQSLYNSSKETGKYNSRISKDEPKINRININTEDEKDPFLPIIDIIRASIVRYDYATARDGLRAVSDCLCDIIKQNPREEKIVSEHVFRRIHEIWTLALKIKDIELIHMILIEYWYIGQECTYPVEKSDSAYINFILKLKTESLISLYLRLNKPHYKEKVTQNNLLYTTFLSECYLKKAFESIVEVKDEEFQDLSTFFARKISDIGSDTFKNRYELEINKPVKDVESLECSISEFSYILKDVGIAAINAGSKSAFKVVIDTFNYIGKAAICHNLIHSIAHILKNLKIIGEESAKNGGEFETLTKQIVECLENLASKIDSNSQELSENTQNQLVEYYEYIKLKYPTYETTKDALKALKNREKRDISDIYAYISMIARESIKTNLLDVTRQCLRSLETVERILKNGTESRHIGERILSLGEEAVKKEQTFPLMKDIIKSLYSISLLQFGYMFDWEKDRKERQKFLERESSDYLARGLQSSDSDFVNEDTEDFSYGSYPDNIIYGEKKLIIDGKERKDIKCLNLKDIDDRYPTLKLFKIGVFKNSEQAYYEVPELLWKLADPILKYTLNLPCDKTREPFDMIIQCFENFGIMSIHFRDNFSLNEISKHLTSIGYSFSRLSTSEDNKKQNAWENLDCATTVVSRSIYKLAIGSLRYKFVDSSILYQQMDCLIRIQREYHNSLFDAAYKFKSILEMIKESELKESEREKIITITENAIEEFKNQKIVLDDKKLTALILP